MKTELLSLLNELPELYKGIVSSIGSLKNATHYYEAFVNFLVPRCVTQHTSHSLCIYIYCKLFFSASRLEPCTCDTYCTTRVYVNRKMQIKRQKSHAIANKKNRPHQKIACTRTTLKYWPH